MSDTTTKPTNPKDAIGSNKIPVHLWPNTATYLGAMALLDGACKYGRANWRAIGVRSSIYYDAARRHLDKWFEGHDFDTDDGTADGPRMQGGSGLPHLAHALACIAIVVDSGYAGNLNDDRQFPGGFSDVVQDLTPVVAVIKARYEDKSPHHYTKQDVVQPPCTCNGTTEVCSLCPASRIAEFEQHLASKKKEEALSEFERFRRERRSLPPIPTFEHCGNCTSPTKCWIAARCDRGPTLLRTFDDITTAGTDLTRPENT